MATVATRINSTTVHKLTLLALRVRFRLGSWLAPGATLRRADALFCTPFQVSRRNALAADPQGAEISQLPFAGDRLCLYTWGDPSAQPWVLFSHGWSSHGLRFVPWVRRLREAGYAVIALDHVAHGRSSGRRATLPDFAAALRAVGTRFGPAAAVVGHSLGGAAAMLALADGLRADRAILVAPAADPVDAARRFSRVVGLADFLGARLFDVYEARQPGVIASLHAHVAAPAIARPALVVHDFGDREVPWAEGERYARHWPAARLLTTTGLGHHRILDDERVIDAALRFLGGECVGERVVSTPNLPYGFA